MRARLGRRGTPVSLDLHAAVLRDEDVPGRELVNAAQSRPLARHILQREVLVDRLEIDLTGHAGQPQQSLELGCERERAVRQPRPQQRLLAEAVSREHESFARGVP